MDKLETKTFNDGEKTTIINGRVLDITSGGDKITVKGDKTTTVDGNEEHHVTGKITEKYDSGQDKTIEAGGITVNVNSGDWHQNVNAGKIRIFSPDEITIESTSKVSIKTPSSSVKSAVHSFSLTGFSESLTGNSVSATGNSISGTGMSSSITTVSNSFTALSNTSTMVSYATHTVDNKRSLLKIEDSIQNMVISAIHLFI